LISSLNEQNNRNQELDTNLKVVKRALETNTVEYKGWCEQQKKLVEVLQQGATKSDKELGDLKARHDQVLQTYRGIESMSEVLAHSDELANVLKAEEAEAEAVQLKIEAAEDAIQLAQNTPFIMSQCDRLARMAERALEDGICFDCARSKHDAE
jgi:hypothetical protein